MPASPPVTVQVTLVPAALVPSHDMASDEELAAAGALHGSVSNCHSRNGYPSFTPAQIPHTVVPSTYGAHPATIGQAVEPYRRDVRERRA